MVVGLERYEMARAGNCNVGTSSSTSLYPVALDTLVPAVSAIPLRRPPQAWKETRNSRMIGPAAARTGCRRSLRSCRAGRDRPLIYLCFSTSYRAQRLASSLTTNCAVSFCNVKVPKTFSTSGLTYNNTRISVAHISRTCGNQVVP